MRVLRGNSSLVSAPTALAIGNFDGVHRGHVALLQRLCVRAKERQLTPAVLTFEPHPREFFSPASAPARLSILREKLQLIAACGVEVVMICRFDADFSPLSAQEFIDRTLVARLQIKHLLIGDDFRFGRARQGDFALLRDAGQKSGFTVEAMSAVEINGERISSSAVRDALAAGEIARATALLGRPYTIDGRVVHGDKLGRRLGFNTANIHIRHYPLPMTGVFAVEVDGLSQGTLQGVANLGIRPTRGGDLPLLEVHLLDFDGSIYGKHLSVCFMHKIRDEQRFPDLDALKAQIAKDALAARDFFKL